MIGSGTGILPVSFFGDTRIRNTQTRGLCHYESRRARNRAPVAALKLTGANSLSRRNQMKAEAGETAPKTSRLVPAIILERNSRGRFHKLKLTKATVKTTVSAPVPALSLTNNVRPLHTPGTSVSQLYCG